MPEYNNRLFVTLGTIVEGISSSADTVNCGILAPFGEEIEHIRGWSCGVDSECLTPGTESDLWFVSGDTAI